MSLFDLQDVCIVIGSLATLDLPMVVDLIGIYLVERTVLYANHDQLVLAGTINLGLHKTTLTNHSPCVRRPLLSQTSRPRLLPCAAVPPPRDRTCFNHRDEEIPFVLKSVSSSVQTDGGLLFPVVDLIRRSTAAYNSRAGIPCESGCQPPPCAAATTTARRPTQHVAQRRPPCADVAHGDAQAAPCMAQPCRTCRGSARPCAARYVMAAAAAVRRISDSDATANFLLGVYADATCIHGPTHIIEGVMYAGKLYTSLTLVVSRLELPLTLAHIIGDVKGTVLHDSTLMGHLDM
ncbi:hypothetical protein F511_25595 [Dorcoceras hygrometricum]|uniref:Uncharacterized protein n=1 Tax=Dorcoceras hygrometricum TaxID=472368 RepID=A0A2Z7D0G3_9LAMI|nr:hypothetical protein F511_25595 [Dorcoceras hygrometricum]